VASQVNGQASTSSKLSPFAQQVAAADTARLNPPINAPKSNPILGRNVPTNPLNPSVGPMTSSHRWQLLRDRQVEQLKQHLGDQAQELVLKLESICG
jgi:hypothetical protein